MLIKSKKLEKEIEALKNQINHFPKGKFICNQNGKYCKWYYRKDQKLIYIPKDNISLAQNLAKKQYLACLLADKTKELRAIQFYISHYPPISKAEKYLKTPGIKNLLNNYLLPQEDLLQWVNSDYERNTSHPEHLIHQCTSQIYVRSKSESLIGTMLHMNQIPFRYECALELGSIKLFPDFTICHPKKKSIYYWEHFGMMDNPTYSQNAFSKQQLYINHGILPNHQLIITYETQEHPLSSSEIHDIISYYFS